MSSPARTTPSLQKWRVTFKLAAPIYHMLGNAKIEPLGHIGQPATASLAREEHALAQGTSLCRFDFIGNLVTLTNFEEKSLCHRLPEPAVTMKSGEGNTSQNPTVTQEEQPNVGNLCFFPH